MSRKFVLPVVFLLAAACEQSADEVTATAGADDAPPVVEETATFSGADAYQLACAQCHDEGLEGAPKIGDQEAWAGRSWLWEAVLFEHAKKGYKAMPAKGGHEELSDQIVEMAAEYMLNITTGAPAAE